MKLGTVFWQTPSKQNATPSKISAKINLPPPKHIPKSQQNLFNCSFCFLPLENEKNLNAHLLQQHNYDPSLSQNDNNVDLSPKENKIIKLEPGTSPPNPESAEKIKYKCTKCSFRNTYAVVKEHQHMEHSDCGYMCDYTLCTYLFTTVNGLRKHLLKSHGKKNPFVCEICEKIFYFRGNYKGHECGKSPIAGGKRFQCKFKCGYRASTEWDVKRHTQNHCPLNPKIMVRCRICKKDFGQFDFPVHKEQYHQKELVQTRHNADAVYRNERSLRQRDENGKVAKKL